MVRWMVAALMVASVMVPLTAAQSPDSSTQPEADGCERDPGQLLAGTSPQWVYVNRDNEPQLVRGIAVDAYPTYTDLFRVHDSYDMNLFFVPDADSQQFLATANFEPDEEYDRPIASMEVEWEQRAYAMFAWPTAGDRVDVMGSWIWDCGHWMDTDFTNPTYFAPGTQPTEPVTGERTEIHPPRMVVVYRTAPSTSAAGSAVADVLISSQGTVARSVQEHAAGFCSEPNNHDCPQWTPVNDRDYVIDVDAPERPEGATELQWFLEEMGSVNAPAPNVTLTATGIRVTVPFEGWGSDGDDMVFAKRVTVGWDVPQPVRHLRLTLDRLEWIAELDGPVPFTCIPGTSCTGEAQASETPDEVNVYFEAAGQWIMIDEPGLAAVAPGDAFDLDASFDLYLAEDAAWRVLVRGRECDQPMILECTADEAGLNDDAGLEVRSFNGTLDAAGNYTSSPMSHSCEAVGASACFTIEYKIEDMGLLNEPAPPPVISPGDLMGAGEPPEPEADPADQQTPGLGVLMLVAAVAVALARRQLR